MIKNIGVFTLSFFKSLKLFPLRLVDIIGQLFPEDSFGCKVRGKMYSFFLKKCGANFQVALRVKLEHLRNIEVGNDVYIGYGSWISGLRGGIELHDEVMLGPYVKMISSNHTFNNGSARFAQGVGGRIVIGRGTWIASGVVITAGTEIGQSCLLAAGSIVTKNIPEDSIVAGIPGKVIGKVSEKYLI